MQCNTIEFWTKLLDLVQDGIHHYSSTSSNPLRRADLVKNFQLCESDDCSTHFEICQLLRLKHPNKQYEDRIYPLHYWDPKFLDILIHYGEKSIYLTIINILIVALFNFLLKSALKGFQAFFTNVLSHPFNPLKSRWVLRSVFLYAFFLKPRKEVSNYFHAIKYFKKTGSVWVQLLVSYSAWRPQWKQINTNIWPTFRLTTTWQQQEDPTRKHLV